MAFPMGLDDGAFSPACNLMFVPQRRKNRKQSAGNGLPTTRTVLFGISVGVPIILF